MKKHYISILLLIPSFMMGQNAVPDVNVEDDERELRENPNIDGLDDDVADITIPKFVKESDNHIMLNNADWTAMRKRLDLVSRRPFSIVHIGDSHLQADIATGLIREYLQYDFGNAGRGLVAPLKMSGTNQPNDYIFSSTKSWSAVKLMGQKWARTMGFTGASITPTQSESMITVGTRENNDYNPFSSVTVFHSGQFFVTGIKNANGELIPYVATPSQDYTHIDLTEDVTSVTITFESAGDLTIFGANLSGNRPGIFYHTIGNNGATYDTYNRIGHEGEGLKPLNPDLVIISLGTNEAFGRFDARKFEDSMNRLIENIKKFNPEATILLTTPIECQRSVYTTVRKKAKSRRRKSRTVKQRLKGYSVNNNILPIRNAILEYGKEHNIAVYDWYDVAGGGGASNKWLSSGLYSKDRVHHSAQGYRLQGFMLYKALKEALTTD